MATLWLQLPPIFAPGIADLFIQVTRFGVLMLDPRLRTRGETLGVNHGQPRMVWDRSVLPYLETVTRPGEHTKSYGKSPFFGNGFVSTISTGPFSSSQTVSHYQRVLMENSEMMGIYTWQTVFFSPAGYLFMPCHAEWQWKIDKMEPRRRIKVTRDRCFFNVLSIICDWYSCWYY